MNDVVKVVGKHLHTIRKKSGKRVSLVGWSLAGFTRASSRPPIPIWCAR